MDCRFSDHEFVKSIMSIFIGHLITKYTVKEGKKYNIEICEICGVLRINPEDAKELVHQEGYFPHSLDCKIITEKEVKE